jgi:hypothetical protein
MTIIKKKVIDKIEVLEMGQIQIRQATRIIEDGNLISQTFHRHVIEPDLDDLTGQDEKVQLVANVVWTDDVKNNWADFKET